MKQFKLFKKFSKYLDKKNIPFEVMGLNEICFNSLDLEIIFLSPFLVEVLTPNGQYKIRSYRVDELTFFLASLGYNNFDFVPYYVDKSEVLMSYLVSYKPRFVSVSRKVPRFINITYFDASNI